jgi:hypothetical protein
MGAERRRPFRPFYFLSRKNVGRTVASYSSALRRAIAIAQMETAASEAGTMLMLTLAPARRNRDSARWGARGTLAVPARA